jgi:S-adenosylmethionine synthetase
MSRTTPVSTRVFTSESVTEGHPDKVCDYISDSILDAHLAGDENARVACETLCKENIVVVAGEITSNAHISIRNVVRQAIHDVGYTDRDQPFCDQTFLLLECLSTQAQEIKEAVDEATDVNSGAGAHDQGAGDQGMMMGYATDETPELMPLPIILAHRITRGLAEDRKSGAEPWLRPDGKAQVSVEYEGNEPRRVTHVIVSMQHRPEAGQEEIRKYARARLLPRVLGPWFNDEIRLHINSSGHFTHGGPSADCGLTGRKIIVDTYGGLAHHGGGAFSGKDPSKVDRSGAYFGRYVARQAVLKKLARRVEIQVAYAIGEANPLAVNVETFGTGDPAVVAAFVTEGFDFRPQAMIERLKLRRPIYRQTTNYGHFGKPGLPWEE